MAWPGNAPPYRIETERLVLRCYDPHDAPLVKEAIDESVEHLREFMPWTDAEPQTLEEKVELCRRFRAAFDSGENFTYGIFDRGETRLLGGAGLHPRVGPGGLEIGYWVRASEVRRGIATEALRLVLPECRALGIDPALLTCDTDNAGSARVIEANGGVLEDVRSGKRRYWVATGG